MTFMFGCPLLPFLAICSIAAGSPPAVEFYAAPKPLPAGAVTEDWPAFLGPRRDGVSRETKLLKQWPEGGPRLVWALERGSGYSSPSVVGRNLVYMHRMGAREIVVCLHCETGRQRWQFGYPTTYEDRYGFGNGPRATPVIDNGHVYTIGSEGQLHCLDLETGTLIWNRDLAKDLKLRQGFFGFTSTPLVEGGRIVINVGAPGGPCVVALDKSTGKRLWNAGNQWGASYASPVGAEIHGKRRVFVFAGGESRPPHGGLLCINPIDGHIDFRFAWRSRRFESVNAVCPVVIGNRVFISASYKTGGAMLNVRSDFTHEVDWTTSKFGCHFSNIIARDGYLYGFDGRHRAESSLVCYEDETGQEQWRFSPQWKEKIDRNGQISETPFGIGRGSLLLVDNHFLCLGEMGHLLWLDLSPDRPQILARTWLFATPETWTPPVISQGLLYIAQNHRDMISGTPPRLLCYDLRAWAKTSSQ